MIQRHPPASDRKPPMAGPKAGPKNGATQKMPNAIPRRSTANVSAMIPPGTHRELEPNTPARKRNMISDHTFWATVHIDVHMVCIIIVAIMISRLPITSDTGPHTKGPTA